MIILNNRFFITRMTEFCYNVSRVYPDWLKENCSIAHTPPLKKE